MGVWVWVYEIGYHFTISNVYVIIAENGAGEGIPEEGGGGEGGELEEDYVDESEGEEIPPSECLKEYLF